MLFVGVVTWDCEASDPGYRILCEWDVIGVLLQRRILHAQTLHGTAICSHWGGLGVNVGIYGIHGVSGIYPLKGCK